MWPALLLLGVAVGLLAGLFGIGGGTLMVPMLTLLLMDDGLDASSALHLALGTSMASIVATACASAWAHFRLGTICWRLVTQLAPGITVGTAVVSLWVPSCDARWLAIGFALYVVAVAIWMLRQPSVISTHSLPGALGISLIGSGIGGVSALVSIGGGTMVVPLLSWGGVAMRQAIGSSAAIGVVISVVGTIGYSMANRNPMVESVAGAIYLPAVLLISLAGMVMAPIGARWSQSLSAGRLRQGYALLLILLGVTMLWAVGQ